MSISWFSPLDPKTSEIARYSAQLLPSLERLISIEGVNDGTAAPASWPPPHDQQCIEPGVAPMPVYHIGNNSQHLPIYLRSLEEPGLVVLHDLSLVDVAKYLSHQLEQPDLWKELMCRQYGEEVRELVNRSEKSVDDYNEMVVRYPLFQPFVAGAMGVIVHSQYARDALRQQLDPGTPLLQLNLPAPAPPATVEKNYHRDYLRFVFCGHVGPNRRLVEFMEAWAQLATPERMRLDLFGNISNNRQLVQYAEHFGVADYVTFRGYVSDAELEESLHSSDFAINLRWPTMGEASASQLRYWSAALPTLVSDVGWYGELPDDAVCKISVENEAADLQALLESALAEPGRYRQVGLRGWEHLRSAHTAEHYAEQLVALARQLTEHRLAYRMLDRDLVTAIASMCENDTDTRLFRDAIETAVDTCAPAV
jgi:glycosyltransferase involved in cell wall biosynthesis